MSSADSVLVTGAGTGIGLATALHLAERGFRVYASVPNTNQREGVDKAASQHGLSVQVLPLDVTDRRSIQSAVDTIMAEAGGIYGLVHSAGLGLRGFFEDLAEEEVRRLFEVNVFGVMAVTRAALPFMREARRGRIVVITSAGGRIAEMTLSGYAASKFALEGFGESLVQEVMPLGLHVSLIEPGLVFTPHFTVNRGRAQAAMDPSGPYYAWFAEHEAMVDDVLLQRRITAEDVARSVGQALVAKRPKLRYVVGWRAKLLITARKYLPGESFELLQRWQMQRRVIRPKHPAGKLNDLTLAGDGHGAP